MHKNTFAPLFESYRLNNGVEVKNRLVVAPMTHFASHADGTLSDEERHFLHNRAENIGLFITAATLVAEGGKAFVGQPEAIYAKQLDSLKETAQLIQSQGAKAILQIHHGGHQSIPNLLNGRDLVTASDEPQTGARALTGEEVESLVQSFANAADLALQAGFDGVEIHGANGFLIQQFVSAQINHRTDKWGENRYAFSSAVVDAVVAVREKHNRPDFIIGYRFSPEEPGENGITMQDTFGLIDVLVNKSLQYLHVSLWDFYKLARRGADETKPRIEQIHQRIAGRLALIGVGDLYTAEQILAAYQTGWAEFIALGKTVMINPNIATLIKDGKTDEIVTELDPDKADRYGIPDYLWQLCIQGGAWLPPVKGQAYMGTMDI